MRIGRRRRLGRPARDRDPDHVLRDVRDELVSITSAESDYGVIINACSMTVDEKATGSLREEMRAKRTSSKPSFVSWDDNGTEKALEAAEYEQAHKRT